MRKLLFVIPVLALTACNPGAVNAVVTDINKLDVAVNTACDGVLTAASIAAPFAADPTVASLLAFASGSCGSAKMVANLTAKAASDPNTIAWINNLEADIKKTIATVRTTKF